LALGIRRLDYLVITHADPDHVEGAPGVARDFGPRELWEGVPVPPHQTLRRLETMVARDRGTTRLARTDDHLRIGAVELRVLYPPEPDWERQRVRNDDSIVMELRYGDVSIVLPGDIGSSVEESLGGKLSDAPVRILKAAHHGSASSSSDTWLSAARAAAVIFSCGRDNRYGHPAPIVLERVASHGAAVFRTDQDGAITVTTDGTSATVSTFTGRTRSFRAPASLVSPITGNHEEHEGHEGHDGSSR
jgi:competence protein ComEC